MTLSEYSISSRYPQNYNIASTLDLFLRCEEILLPLKEELDIKAISSRKSRSSRFSSRVSTRLTLYLVDADEGHLTTDEVQKRVAALLPKDIPGIRFKSGYSRGSSATGVGVEIKGRSQEILNMLAEDVELNMQGLSGVHDVESSLESGTEEIRVVVDRKRAQRLGLSPRLMTATTTILGLAPLVLPMIYGQAEGNARRWGPIGLVVISGLFASTLMTLILLPTVYSLMDDLSTWIRRFVAMARTSSTRATS